MQQPNLADISMQIDQLAVVVGLGGGEVLRQLKEVRQTLDQHGTQMVALLNLQTPLEFVNIPSEEQLAQIVTWGQHINTLVTQLGQEREPIHRVLEDLHSRAQNMSTAWETLYKILQGWQPTLQRMETDVGTIQGLQGGCSGARTDWLRYA